MICSHKPSLEWSGTLNATSFRSPGRPWMLSGPEPGNPDSLSARRRPSLTFWSLLRKKRFLLPKDTILSHFPHFGLNKRFWNPKRTFGPKIAFGPQRAPFSLESHWFYKHPRHGDAKMQIYTKNAFLAPKCKNRKKGVWGMKTGFRSIIGFFGIHAAQMDKKITCM